MSIHGFVVHAKPEGQPRVRPGSRGGWFVPRTAFFQACIAAALRGRPRTPYTVPLRLVVEAVMPRPKSAPKGKHFHTAPPDGDNILKAICDAATHAGWWKSDAIISDKRIIKRLARPWEKPFCLVEVSSLVNEEIQIEKALKAQQPPCPI